VLERLIVSGFGGQGVLFLCRIVAQAMMHAGQNVTFFPAYGPEVRGGRANCHVIVSSGEIFSPLVTHADALVAMNQASWDYFLPSLLPDGLAVINTSLATPQGEQPSQRLVPVRATDIANGLGDVRVTNMVMLGAYNHVRGLLGLGDLLEHLREALGRSKAALFDLNRRAVERGLEAADALR